MIDLNHLLLFVAVISPLAVLARAWRPAPSNRGWRLAAIIVLAVAGMAWLLVRPSAGYIAAGAWMALLFIPAIGLRHVGELAARRNFGRARRVAKLLRVFHPTRQLRDEIATLGELETRQAAGELQHWPNELTTPRPSHWHNSAVVITLIVANVAVFLFQIGHADWQSERVMHRLGALDPGAVLYRHEYWRLFTALFLHHDIVHLLFNVFALFVLGPPLERGIGGVRFGICYLLSGLGSSAGVVALVGAGILRMYYLVGASGCVMGIVGAWAAFLVRNRHAPMAKQRLKNVAMIVVIQVLFDVSTPQVSTAAHLCGLVSGFAVGLVLSRRNASI
jgi:membrane associated rhomboid family serine protease